MKEWSFYSEQDGLFSSRRLVSTSSASLKRNVPAGYRAIEGRFDHLSQRVDLATGEVIVDESLSDVRDKERRRNATLQQIAELERQQPRPLRELAFDPNNATAKTRLRAIDEQIAALRISLGD